MLPDRVSNSGPLTLKSGALPIALRGPAFFSREFIFWKSFTDFFYDLRKFYSNRSFVFLTRRWRTRGSRCVGTIVLFVKIVIPNPNR